MWVDAKMEWWGEVGEWTTPESGALGRVCQGATTESSAAQGQFQLEDARTCGGDNGLPRGGTRLRGALLRSGVAGPHNRC